MEWIILFRLLFAHTVCDFILQSKETVLAKCSSNRSKKLKAQLGHSLLHALSAYMAVWQWNAWYVPVVIFVSHLGIDWAKSVWEKKKTQGGKRKKLRYFLIDQCLHIAVIVVLWLVVSNQFTTFGQWASVLAGNSNVWLVAMAYLLVTKPVSIIISLFISRWMPDVKEPENKSPHPQGVISNAESLSLAKAGMWIGYLERILIVSFILLGQWAAVGFLLAAKSIFRIGDLRPGGEFKLTEYVLIGTFSSFFAAIVMGVLVETYIIG